MRRVHVLNSHIYREYGNALTGIGLTVLLTYTVIVILLFRNPMEFSRLIFPSQAFIILSLGLILTYSGVFLRRRYNDEIRFLTKDGETIHSVKPWYKGPESGLYLTSCGLVVSINQESEATANVGYRRVSVKKATHGECIVAEGKVILESTSKRRSW
ncbi:MAG: hypothetical protein ACFFDD_15880 [Promethearchaeota archaeon]